MLSCLMPRICAARNAALRAPQEPDCYAGDGNARRHLRDGVEGVDAVEVAAGKGNANDGQGGPGRYDAGKPSRAARRGYEHFDAPIARAGNILHDLLRGAVR